MTAHHMLIYGEQEQWKVGKEGQQIRMLVLSIQVVRSREPRPLLGIAERWPSRSRAWARHSLVRRWGPWWWWLSELPSSMENGDGDWWWSSMRMGRGGDFDFECSEDPNIWKMSVHFSGFPNHLCLGYGCKEPWAARRGKFGWSCMCHHLVSGWIESTSANLMSHFLMKC